MELLMYDFLLQRILEGEKLDYFEMDYDEKLL